MIFGKKFSKTKLLFHILPLNRKLLKDNSFHETYHPTLSTCKTRLMIHSIRLTTRSTLSIHFFTRSTRFSTRSIRLSTRSTRLSTHNTCLSTRSTICRSFYHWSYFPVNFVKFLRILFTGHLWVIASEQVTVYHYSACRRQNR